MSRSLAAALYFPRCTFLVIGNLKTRNIRRAISNEPLHSSFLIETLTSAVMNHRAGGLQLRRVLVYGEDTIADTICKHNLSLGGRH